MTSESLLALNEFREQLHRLHEQLQSTGDHKKVAVRFDRWRGQVDRWLTDNFGADELSRFSSAIQPNRVANFEGDWCRMQMQGADSFINSLIDDIETDPESFKLPASENVQQDNGDVSSSSVPDTKDVFIVHGHDELIRRQLEGIIQKNFGLNPIVLSDKPGRGRTLIEKFEEEASECAYAFVLITPDDMISVKDSDLYQSRPNVLFELGWFYGRIKRQRTCLVFKRGTSIPSDLNGINRIEFDKTPEEKVSEIARELKSAGLIST